ncbi:DUF6069 family protein [Actinomadura scrupuli]|uniref:DUF6069 family protein n=1 Tax=Actinomadura scrupuli TaxID=559629 RepID=UPI003D99C2E6
MTTSEHDHGSTPGIPTPGIPTSGIPARTDCPPARHIRGLRALAVTGAVAAALTVWAVAVPLAGIEPAVRTGGGTQPVGPGAIATSALLAGLAGWALLAALERLTSRARRTWTIIAVVVLVLSLSGPLGNGAHTTATVALAGMHLAVGAVLIPALRRSARR